MNVINVILNPLILLIVHNVSNKLFNKKLYILIDLNKFKKFKNYI